MLRPAAARPRAGRGSARRPQARRASRYSADGGGGGWACALKEDTRRRRGAVPTAGGAAAWRLRGPQPCRRQPLPLSPSHRHPRKNGDPPVRRVRARLECPGAASRLSSARPVLDCTDTPRRTGNLFPNGRAPVRRGAPARLTWPIRQWAGSIRSWTPPRSSSLSCSFSCLAVEDSSTEGAGKRRSRLIGRAADVGRLLLAQPFLLSRTALS